MAPGGLENGQFDEAEAILHSVCGDGLSRDDANYALLLLNDAVNRETSMYYVDGTGKAASVWEGGTEARKWGMFLRSGAIVKTMSYLALLDMVLALVSPPTAYYLPTWLKTTSLVCQMTIWGVNCMVAFCRLKYMWKSRGVWFSGASEPPWVMIQVLILFMANTAEWIVYWRNGYTEHRQADGNITYCPQAFSVFIHGWARGWMFIYFNQGVRDALITLLQVFQKLGSITALMVACFLAHFFTFQGLTVGVKACNPDEGGDAAGNCGNFGEYGEIWDALYNLFGLLTTVNHPDCFMWLVDEKWATFLVIISYMFFTNIIGLNLLLAIVYGEYCAILEEALDYKAKLRSTMLDTAFDILDLDGDNTLTPEQLVSILRFTSNEKSLGDDDDRLEMVVRLIDNKAKTADELHLQDGEISRADMHELIVFYTMPLRQKPFTKPKYRFELAIQALEDQKENVGEEEKAEIDAEIERMNQMGVLKWCALVKPAYYFVQEFGANFPPMCESFWPWYKDAIWVQIHTLYFLFYLMYCVFQTADYNKNDTYKSLLFVSMIYQIIFVFSLFIAEMRPWQKMHFFNLMADEAATNICALGLMICLLVEFFTGCKNSCFETSVTDDDSGANTFFMVVGKVFQVISYSVETPAILLLLRSVFKTFPTILPHLGLFLAIYYGFAGMGISFFCGLITESPLPNGTGGLTMPPSYPVPDGYYAGPGYWGQRQLGLSNDAVINFATANPAVNTALGISGVEATSIGYIGAQQGSAAEGDGTWAGSSYGGNPFYYNLNFDGFPGALATLYVVMIQNNWTTAADGAVQAKGWAFRWYFFSFTIVNAFVMINVLVGAIIDSLDAIRQEMVAQEAGETDELEDTIAQRIRCTRAPSGRLYGDTWELGDVTLHDEVRFDAKFVATLFAGDDAEMQVKKLQLEKQLESAKTETEDLQDRKARLQRRLALKRQEMSTQKTKTGAPSETVNI